MCLFELDLEGVRMRGKESGSANKRSGSMRMRKKLSVNVIEAETETGSEWL